MCASCFCCRPGRFDRHVNVPAPDVEGRKQILQSYMKLIPTASDVDVQIIARGTPGFSGADLSNLVNVAALHAAKNNSGAVTMASLEYARDRIMMGAERRSAVITDKNKQITAYHEGMGRNQGRQKLPVGQSVIILKLNGPVITY